MDALHLLQLAIFEYPGFVLDRLSGHGQRKKVQKTRIPWLQTEYPGGQLGWPRLSVQSLTDSSSGPEIERVRRLNGYAFG